MDNSYRLRLKGQSPQSDTQVKAKRPSPGSPRHFNKRPASGERSLSRGEAYPTGLQAASASSPPWTVAQSPQREQYSDRYIPCRMPYRSPGSSSIIASPPQQLAVVRTLDETSRIERDTSDSTSNGDTNTASTELDSDMPHNPSLGTYSQLLRNELLGDGDRLSENALAVAAAVSARTETAGTRRRGHSAVATRNGGATAAGGNSAASSPSVGARRASVLQYQGAVPHESLSPFALSPVGADSVRLLESPRRTPRKIPKVPFKVLDAPDLQDDFYLNLVDWSEQNVLCVGLGTCVYLWSAHTSQVTKLCDLGTSEDNDVHVTSVKWINRGAQLAVGTSQGVVQIWDTAECQPVRALAGHVARVGALAWNSQLLSSGSRDRKILQRDLRSPDAYVSALHGHKQEVCGLEWSPDGQYLASGGNDNKLIVWNAGYTQPQHRFTDHIAAVKAIAWSPHQHGLLASGGGTADQCIRFWNTLTNQSLQCIETKSQVCNLAWAKHTNELVSTHGYSQNQIVLWKYPAMKPIATLTGHTYRVLYLAMSPDGESIVTGAGDETLRFWNVFNKTQAPKQTSSVLNLFTHIR
eukprot:m.695512 g.695512  ORF g.695512 m.695512 type:complete len:581 (+) comp22889_c0_seq2:235-1977(+)